MKFEDIEKNSLYMLRIEPGIEKIYILVKEKYNDYISVIFQRIHTRTKERVYIDPNKELTINNINNQQFIYNRMKKVNLDKDVIRKIFDNDDLEIV